MNNDHSWFTDFYKTEAYQLLKKRPVVYFCMEFALYDALPIFAGGLGILAADFVKEASSREIPLVAVGIYYNEGYVFQQVDEDGQIKEFVNATSAKELDLTPVISENGERIYVEVPIEDRCIKLQAWVIRIGSVPVYLLDTNIAENSEEDRKITGRLYSGEKQTRLKQEIVLGIGGLRFIEKLGIHPLVYHMNEGHSALLSLELIRHEMREHNVSFTQAREFAKKRIIFTNHTLVTSANDLLEKELIIANLSTYVSVELKVSIDEVLPLGKEGETGQFSMTALALHMAGKINAVSKLHAKKALSIWPKNPMIPITNGIASRWNKIPQNIPVSQAHIFNKRQLLSFIYNETGQVWEEDELILGWARRMAEYKRPLAILEDVKQFVDLTQRINKKIHIVFAGEAHPGNLQGLEIIKQIRSILSNDLKGIGIYLPNYNLFRASILTSGCDVWINTPFVGFEACGTSGMKAAMNGVLPLTTKDGWVDEVDLSGIGWILDSNYITDSFLEILEQKIIPLYQTKEWENYMIRARELILGNFTATRMLREYLEQMYLPVIENS